MTLIVLIYNHLLSISSFWIHILGIAGIIAVIAIINVILIKRLTRRMVKSRIHDVLREKNMLKQLFDNMPDYIYFKDRDSKFILANKHVALSAGVSDPDKLIGKTDMDFYDPKYAKGYYEDEQRAMKEGKPIIAREEKTLDPDGHEIFISTSKIPIRDSKGNVIGIIGIGRDITEHKMAMSDLRQKSEYLKESNVLLEERQEEIQQMAEELNVQAENLKLINNELERLSLVASRTANVVVIMDGNGNFEWVNKAFENKYGLKMKAFVREYGRNIRENSANESISVIINQIYITKQPYTYNAKFSDKNGDTFWNQTTISPILNANHEITRLILIDSDITEIKNAESKIKQQKTEIEKQAMELRRTNATKDRLFSIIAHDLKNPFHSIIGFTDLLQRKYDTIEREQLNEYLGLISESTQSAYLLLENLLDWARTQTKNVKFNPTPINISDLVEEIIHLQNLHATNKHIILSNEVDESLVVEADKNMLNTVLRNISSNSIKFTNEGGSVTFSASMPDRNNIAIQITDTGIGIPPEKLEKLFKLDEIKSSSGTSGETGTGLGLIVCFEFIKLNGGEISVDSQPGRGTVFNITLPIFHDSE